MNSINFIKKNYALIVILFVGLVLRFYKIGFQSPWADEISTMVNASPDISFADVIRNVNQKEGFPYFYFILMRVLHTLSYSYMVGRIVSAIAGVVSIYYLFKLGRAAYSKNAGLLAAGLLAINEFSIYSSQDARPYSLIMLATILSFYRLVLFIKEPTKKNALYYGAFTGLMLNTSFFALITAFSQAIILLLTLRNLPRYDRQLYLKNVLVAGGLGLLLFLPNVFKFTSLIGVDTGWIPKPGPDSLSLIFKEFLGTSEITVFILTILAAVYAYTTFRAETTEGNEDSRQVFSFRILLIWVSVFIAVMYVKSLLSASVMLHRYFISILPALLVVFAIALDSVKSRQVKLLSFITLAAFLLINTLFIRQYYSAPAKTQYRELAEYIGKNAKPGEKLFTDLALWVNVFMKEGSKLENRPSLDAVLAEMRNDSTKVSAFWYANADKGPYAVSPENDAFIRQTFYVSKAFDGKDVWARNFILKKDSPQSGNIDKFQNPGKYNGDPFMFNIEQKDDTAGKLLVKGWAFFEKTDAASSKIKVVLIKDGRFYPLTTKQTLRPDVTQYFKSSTNVDNSGFEAAMDMASLEPGQYTVAIHIYNQKTGQEGLNQSDFIVQKK